jgi:hypothetical protein
MTHAISSGASVSTTDRHARARKAVSVFRSMQPVLNGYARTITGRSDVRVILSATSNGQTDGKNIMMRPPIALGDTSPHEHILCNRRDLTKKQMCDACARRERVVVTIFHEIGHIAGNSFSKPSDSDLKNVLSDAVRASGSYFGKMLAKRIRNVRFESYLAMADAISPFMHPLLNALEDARIDSDMFKARPGIRPMYEALLNEVRDDGIEGQDPVTGEISYERWADRPLNSQIIFGLYCVGTAYDYTEWFDPQVEEDLDDPKLVELVNAGVTSSSIRGVYYSCFGILERLRELGYCKLPEDPEEESEAEEPESDPEPEPEVPDVEPLDLDGDFDEDEDEEQEEKDEGDSEDAKNREGDSGSDDSEPGESESGGEGSDSKSDQEVSDDPGPETGDEKSEPTEDEDADEQENSSSGQGGEDDGSGESSDSTESEDSGDDETDGDDGDESDTDFNDDDEDVSTEGHDGESGESHSVEPKNMGTPEEAHEILEHAHDADIERVMDPAEQPPTHKAQVAQADQEAQEEIAAVIIAIIQSLFFDEPSHNVTMVREHKAGQPIIEQGQSMSFGWSEYNESEISIPESILGSALLRMRVAFSDNQRGKKTVNLKSGRVNPKVLGRRAPVNDERLMLKTTRPKKKKYAVVLGIDISGSTSGNRLEVIKRAAYAQAELCNRVGLSFEVYAHTGSAADFKSYVRGGDLALDIYIVKESNEPWNQVTQDRLKSLQATMCNLDGHTLEYYRKALDRAVGNTKVLVYYTDGAMPMENHEEELEILLREIGVCKRKGYVMLFVGVQNDEPREKYGLDMVRLDDDADIPGVVNALGARINRA